MDGENKGHGHVFKRPDGMLARCGGPAMCHECAHDAAVKAGLVSAAKPDVEKMRMLLKLACLGDALAAADLDARLCKLSSQGRSDV